MRGWGRDKVKVCLMLISINVGIGCSDSEHAAGKGVSEHDIRNLRSSDFLAMFRKQLASSKNMDGILDLSKYADRTLDAVYQDILPKLSDNPVIIDRVYLPSLRASLLKNRIFFTKTIGNHQTLKEVLGGHRYFTAADFRAALKLASMKTKTLALAEEIQPGAVNCEDLATAGDSLAIPGLALAGCAFIPGLDIICGVAGAAVAAGTLSVAGVDMAKCHQDHIHGDSKWIKGAEEEIPAGPDYNKLTRSLPGDHGEIPKEPSDSSPEVVELPTKS